VPDFILRVDGFGFIGVAPPASPAQAGEDDALVKQMRAGDALLDKGDFAAAQAAYGALLPQMEAQGVRYATWIPVLHNSIGVAAYQAKDYPTAIDFFERSLMKAQMHEDAAAMADILENLGETHFFVGHYDDARTFCERSSELNGDRPGRLMENEYWLGRVAVATGDAAAAAAHLDRVMPLVNRVFEAGSADRSRWEGRVARARAGTAVGEDQGDGAPPRLAKEHAEERAIEEGEVKEEDTGLWMLDLADFGLEGTATVQ
jgi:tetratricopeptide (TPR) repeat protein